MKYTGLTYRPPFEADSLLLQVTSGCSHNRCAFCTMYKGVSFEKESVEQIETDLKNRMLGEAYFLRAHYYFILVRLFGGVPMPTEPLTSDSELKMPRATVDEVRWGGAGRGLDYSGLSGGKRVRRRTEFSRKILSRSSS